MLAFILKKHSRLKLKVPISHTKSKRCMPITTIQPHLFTGVKQPWTEDTVEANSNPPAADWKWLLIARLSYQTAAGPGGRINIKTSMKRAQE